MATGRLLGIHQVTVYGHFEDTTRGLDQLDLDIGKGLFQLCRQTGSTGKVVSSNAVLNRHAHSRARLWGLFRPPRIVVALEGEAKGNIAL
jgi:hypothetical protein